MDTLFISDIHLSEVRPEKIELLLSLLRGPAKRASALYILGDLFDYFWLGNDEQTPLTKRIIKELRDFSRGGTPLFFIRGNRELVLDQGFETLTGCCLLEDICVIDIDGQHHLIMHGDRLCIRDAKYQLYRRFMQTPLIKNLFLSFPYGLRTFIVRGLNPYMKKSVQKKPAEIIDVDQDAVIKVMRDYGVQKLIHGHTHRPGTHNFQLDAGPAQRTVLNDWYEEDSVLVCRDGEKTLMRVQDYIDQCEVQGEKLKVKS